MASAAVAELFGVAQQLSDSGQGHHALALYRDFIACHPGNPLLHAVHFNHGVVLQQAGDPDGAASAFLEAIRLQPDFLPPHINLGSVYERLGAAEHALAHWNHALAVLAPVTGDALAHKVAALKQSARLLEQRGSLSLAEDALRRLIEVAPRQRDAVQHWISLRQRQCCWPVLVPVGELAPRDLRHVMAPLSLALHLDDPLLLLSSAWAHCRHDIGYPDHTVPDPGAARRVPVRPADAVPPARRLRVGYLSSDLRAHAIGFLSAEMFELHDRARYETFVYYNGIAAEDAIKRRVRDAVEHWHDIAALDDTAALKRIMDDGIDVLIDVNGHTRGARTALLARRPAPVIVNWLGYPGTMGSPYHHYIVADDFIVPEGEERFYSERVLRLPCYQPNDRKRVVPVPPSRAAGRTAAGLPPEGVVFCVFNGAQKITEAVFGRWMRVLGAVPGSVLWLLKGADGVDGRLRQRAEAAGIDPARLVFAPSVDNAAHLARYALADLFLDTAPYGAHTTASDALWMGVPVLTLPGRSFASRVCGSLVRAAGVPELVCGTADEYVSRAVALGRDPAALAAYREKLLVLRHHSTLFDTQSFVRGMESLFDRMWAERMAGNLPRPDLSGLDTYLEIGAALERDEAASADWAVLEARYRHALEQRHAFSPLPPDTRLWTPDPPPSVDGTLGGVSNKSGEGVVP